MSRLKLKKYISQLPKEDLVELVLQAYDARKETKEFFEFYLNPDEKPRIEKIKLTISTEFYPVRARRAKMRYSRIHRLIKNFEKLGAGEQSIIELNLYYIDIAADYALHHRYGTDKVIVDAVKTLAETKGLIDTCGLKDIYRPAIERIDRNMAKYKF
jgi:hypothetical protein